MKLKKFFAVSLVLTIICSFSCFAADDVPSSVIRASESVVRIFSDYENECATGSGFVISSTKTETLILTNYHVVVEDNPSSVLVMLNDNANIPASVIAKDKNRDLAVLKVSFPLGFKEVTFERSGITKGKAVYAIGFPAGADLLSDTLNIKNEDSTITDGIVSAVRKVTVVSNGGDVEVLQISAAVNPGNSGGPLVNTSGKVVGICTYSVEDTQGIFGAIAVSEILDFLETNGIEYNDGFSISWWMVALSVALVIGIVILVFRNKKTIERGEKQGQMFSEVYSESVCTNERQPMQRAGKILKPIAIVLAIILVLIAVIFGLICTGEYRVVRYFGPLESVIRIVDHDAADYVMACDKLGDKDYDGASVLFESIKPFGNSEELLKECYYQKADACFGNKNYKEAAANYSSVYEYKDSVDKLNQVYKDWYDTYKNNSYSNDGEATKAFYELVADGNILAEADKESFNAEMYPKAVKMYESKEYNVAKDIFNSMPEYKDSKVYLCLIGVKQSTGDRQIEYAQGLKNHFGIADAKNTYNSICGKEYAKAKQFLKDNNGEQALACFQKISGYSDSNDYIKTLGEGNYWGEVSFLTDNPKSYTYEQLSKVKLSDTDLVTISLTGYVSSSVGNVLDFDFCMYETKVLNLGNYELDTYILNKCDVGVGAIEVQSPFYTSSLPELYVGRHIRVIGYVFPMQRGTNNCMVARFIEYLD